MNRPPHSSRSAFTLVELVIVLVLIAAIVSMAAPALSNFGQGRRLVDTADQIVALARWARTQSIARGIAFRLNLDQSQGGYWLSMQTGPSFSNLLQNDTGTTQGTTVFDDVGESWGSQFNTPDGVSLACSAAPQTDGLYIAFYPSGRCDPATITLTDPKGQTTEVGCLSATESWHVLSDDERQQEQTLTATPIGPSR